MFAEVLRERLAGIVVLTEQQVCALERHFVLLGHWNRLLNLTTVRTVEEAAERHYCESLFLGAHLPEGTPSVVDIGSGAGFPGFPVAILRPECSVTLVESHQRKAVFLRECSRDVPNVRVIAGRAETVSERFDWVVSRAVNVSEMRGVLVRLGANLALLAGEEPPLEGVEWRTPVRLPWGKRRHLWIGACFT